MPGVVKMVNSARADFLKGVHQPGDVYKMALYSSTVALHEGVDVYIPDNEAMGIGYDAGGKILTGYSVTADQGTGILDFEDPVWLNSTISARGALVYNASKGNRAIVFINLGDLFTSSNGAFRVQLPPPVKETGFIRLR